MLDSIISALERRLPDRIRRQYLAKFALSVAVVAVVTLLASALLFGAVQADIKGNAQESLRLTAEDDAESIASWIDEYEQQAYVISMYQEMQVSDGDAIASTLDGERNQMPDETHSLHYFDAETGEIEYSSGADMSGTTLSDLGLEFHVLERESANADADLKEVPYDSFEVSRVDTSYSDVISYEGSNVIGVVSPVRGKDKGVLVLVEVSEQAGAFTEQIDGQNTQTVDLTDGTVGIDEGGNATGTAYRDGADSPVVGTLRETEASGAIDRDETNEVVAYAPVEGTDWAVVTHAPQSSAYAVADTVRNGFVAVIGIVLLGFVAIGATIGRTTARSLDQLTEQARALARGETDLEIGSDGRVDELGRVQDSVAETQAYIDTAAEQSAAIADHRFDDPVLDREVPGRLGDSIETMGEDLESFIRELEEIASGEFGTTMQRAAAGDLTQRLDPDAGNEALREIAVSFNGMMDDIERTVASISDLAAEVDSVSNEIASNAGQIEEASADVTDSIDDVSESAAEQKDRFDAVHNEMDAISATIEEIASSSTQVADVTTDAAERAEATRDDAEDVLEEMARIEERTDEVTERIRELGSEMEQIDEIVALIDEIAEQTNILALNANIEAARAGGDGDASEGFGVVADEVKELASETAEATREADSLITELQASTEAVVDDVGEVQNSVESGVRAVKESIDAIDEIADRVEEAEQGVQSINQATDEQATSTEDVARMVDEVIEISEETDAEADNVASAAREQTASIARISEGTEELTERSQALRTELGTFEWNASGESAVEPDGEAGSNREAGTGGTEESEAFGRAAEPGDAADTEPDGPEGSVAGDD